MSPERALPSLAVLLLAALTLPGCLEQEVTTTIHRDGTCDRTIVLQGSASSPADGLFPVTIDSTWDSRYIPKDTSGAGPGWTLRKHFSSYEDLSREYEGEPAPGKLQVTVKVEKSFRWFYTYFDYQESYGRFSPYNLLPPSLVMTDDEILRYTYGDTSAALRQKVDEWEARNLFQVVYDSLAQAADRLQDLSTAARMEARKEDAFRAFYAAAQNNRQADSIVARAGYRGPTDNLFEDGRITEAGVDAMTEVAVKIFRTDTIRKLKGALRGGWKEMEVKGLENIDRTSHSQAFTNTIVMPGTVLETSAPDVKGNVLSWKFETSHLALHDYEMHAGSRVINVWALVVTGLLVLGLLAVAFAVPALLRRRLSLTPAE